MTGVFGGVVGGSRSCPGGGVDTTTRLRQVDHVTAARRWARRPPRMRRWTAWWTTARRPGSAPGRAARGGAGAARPELPPHGRLPHRAPRAGQLGRGAEPAERGRGARRAAGAGRRSSTRPPSVFVGGPVDGQDGAVPGRRPHRARAGRRLAGWSRCAARSRWSTWTATPSRSPRGCAACACSPGTPGGTPVSWPGRSARGDWFVVPALPDDVLAGQGPNLWVRVLRRQGVPLALLATFPLDARHN